MYKISDLLAINDCLDGSLPQRWRFTQPHLNPLYFAFWGDKVLVKLQLYIGSMWAFSNVFPLLLWLIDWLVAWFLFIVWSLYWFFAARITPKLYLFSRPWWESPTVFLPRITEISWHLGPTGLGGFPAAHGPRLLRGGFRPSAPFPRRRLGRENAGGNQNVNG